jgi:hypothetical protein
LLGKNKGLLARISAAQAVRLGLSWLTFIRLLSCLNVIGWLNPPRSSRTGAYFVGLNRLPVNMNPFLLEEKSTLADAQAF